MKLYFIFSAQWGDMTPVPPPSPLSYVPGDWSIRVERVFIGTGRIGGRTGEGELGGSYPSFRKDVHRFSAGAADLGDSLVRSFAYLEESLRIYSFTKALLT